MLILDLNCKCMYPYLAVLVGQAIIRILRMTSLSTNPKGVAIDLLMASAMMMMLISKETILFSDRDYTRFNPIYIMYGLGSLNMNLFPLITCIARIFLPKPNS